MGKAKQESAPLVYDQTCGAISRKSGFSIGTIRMYGDRGWIDTIRASNGTRMHPESAAEQARQVYAKRMARTHGPRSAA